MSNKRGVTLLEVSIVAVIIGLLMSGVLVGVEILKNAKLRAVMTDVDGYRQAFGLFKEKYLELPGDFRGAEAMWGTDGAGCPNTTATTPKKETCNGDGDGKIMPEMVRAQTYRESLRAWQHLADAGFIKGIYSGVQSVPATLNSATIGTNVPSTNMERVGYIVFYHSAEPINASWSAPADHYIDIAATGNTQVLNGAVFTPVAALSIDHKMDDGLPGQGSLLATPGGGCTTSTAAVGAEYQATNDTTAACMLSARLHP